MHGLDVTRHTSTCFMVGPLRFWSVWTSTWEETFDVVNSITYFSLGQRRRIMARLMMNDTYPFTHRIGPQEKNGERWLSPCQKQDLLNASSQKLKTSFVNRYSASWKRDIEILIRVGKQCEPFLLSIWLREQFSEINSVAGGLHLLSHIFYKQYTLKCEFVPTIPLVLLYKIQTRTSWRDWDNLSP